MNGSPASLHPIPSSSGALSPASLQTDGVSSPSPSPLAEHVTRKCNSEKCVYCRLEGKGQTKADAVGKQNTSTGCASKSADGTSNSKTTGGSSNDGQLVCVDASTPTNSSKDIKSGPDANELEAVINALRLRLTDNGNVNGFNQKHYYVTGSGSIPSAASIAQNLAQISGGTQLNNRDGNMVRLTRLRMRMLFLIYSSAISTVSYIDALCVRLGVFIDRVPKNPGTSPSIFLVDANPPVNDCVFTMLGVGFTPNSGMTTAIKSPLTEHLYHIKKDHTFNFKPTGQQTFSGAPTFGTIPAQQILLEWDIDMNKLQQSYATTASVNSVNNAVWFYLIGEDTTGTGLTLNYYISSDMVFEDDPAAM